MPHQEDMERAALPLVSLCMIVRDEAEMLPDFLASVDGVWDELCVVDTGSVDETVAMALAAGARVEEMTWGDDFSAARNRSLRMATGQWVLVLDADERPSAEFGATLKRAARDPSVGAATIRMVNAVGTGHRRVSRLLRAFRRVGALRYRHRIHEEIATDVTAMLAREGLRLTELAPEVLHLGYQPDRVMTRDKRTRDERLLRAALAADPNDFYSAYKLMEQGKVHGDDGLMAEAAQMARGALRTLSIAPNRLANHAKHHEPTLQSAPWAPEAICLMALGLYRSAGPAAVIEELDRWGDAVAPSAVFYYWHGYQHELLGDTAAAQSDYEHCLKLPADDYAAQFAVVRPTMGLCRLALSTQDVNAAVGHARVAIARGPGDPEVQLAGLALAELLSSSGEFGEAFSLLGPLAPHLPKAGIGLFVVAMTSQQDVNLSVDMSIEDAASEVARWIDLLRASEQRLALERIAMRAAEVTSLFPWLRARALTGQGGPL